MHMGMIHILEFRFLDTFELREEGGGAKRSDPYVCTLIGMLGDRN